MTLPFDVMCQVFSPKDRHPKDTLGFSCITVRPASAFASFACLSSCCAVRFSNIEMRVVSSMRPRSRSFEKASSNFFCRAISVSA